MKKIVATIVAGAMLCFGVLALAGCGGGESGGQAAGNAAAPADNTLVVGFDQSYPPYGYKDKDTGEFTGVDIDLAKATCEKLGWEIKLEPIDWDAKDALIEQGNITCIWNGFTYEGRENDYAFTEQYMVNGQVVVTKADSEIKTLADLAGDTVRPGGVVVVDTTLAMNAQDVQLQEGVSGFYFPATKMAEEAGLKGLANIICLGKLWAETGFCDREVLDAAIEKCVPPKKRHLLEPNLRAVQLGIDL